MAVLQKPRQSGDAHASRGWHRFGDCAQAVRHTEAWEHETFAEEQARWERGDPEYARICEQVRQARKGGHQGRGVGKLHGARTRPRPNGTLALLRSGRRMTMPRERTVR